MTAVTVPTTAALDLALVDVTCSFGAEPAVRGVHLAVRPGEKAALTGTNGSGKTTLLRAVLGLHRGRVAGRISVGGAVAATRADWARRRRACAWIPQRQGGGAFPLLAEELLAGSGDLAAAVAAAHRLGVAHLLHRPVHTLSGGQVQRVHLARAVGCVAAGAGLLLADEPTAALDFAGQREAADVLLGLPATVVVVTHDRHLADRCDRRLEMAAGALREAP
ncbi:ATP-binding cassette domain-containing protein [Streptomonospora sp. S1-112]|uniref:ATP-binding cassette domain-containing protein n=1 Tax=Streptomonospora mangrovi TaxID=2883123 RepID=A0A9X3SG21_9ACTN|nr:ATP-binding cassette domain-containing protein [Streptomonospora mangrovi]MDA0567448.1 ATP-binding cassette domain-containing protein [Streptomonospora mangrovi]